MPLFGNKFSPKKTPQRKTAITHSDVQLEDLVQENRRVKLQLGQQRFDFDEGDWKPVTGENAGTYRSNQKLRQKLHQVEEENNMLRLKLEILLNMLTETTAENHLQQREIDKLLKHVQVKV